MTEKEDPLLLTLKREKMDHELRNGDAFRIWDHLNLEPASEWGPECNSCKKLNSANYSWKQEINSPLHSQGIQRYGHFYFSLAGNMLGF